MLWKSKMLSLNSTENSFLKNVKTKNKRKKQLKNTEIAL